MNQKEPSQMKPQFGTPIKFTTRCGTCGLTIPYEESVAGPSGDLCRPCAAIHLIRHGGSITGALGVIDAIPTPGGLKARGVLEIEAERLAPKQGPKHKTSGLAESNPRDVMLSEPNSLDSVGQAELGVALDGSGAVLPPQRQEQSTPNTDEAQGKSEIEVGSRWRYLGNHASDVVIEVNGDQIITESASRLAEHCWLRDEFLRAHTPA